MYPYKYPIMYPYNILYLADFVSIEFLKKFYIFSGIFGLFKKAKIYQLIDVDVNLVPLSVTANQRRFIKILHCDWLLPNVGQD